MIFQNERKSPAGGVWVKKPGVFVHDPLQTGRNQTKGDGTMTVDEERARLMDIYSTLPPKKLKVAQGLIEQAARLRVRLDRLWADIEEHGEVEMFSQSEKTDPYERERPVARLFTTTDKNYQSIIKQLADMVPNDDAAVSLDDKMKKLMKDG